jgi:hypothetical protein
LLSPAEIAREYETVIRAAKIMKSNQMVERRWEGLEKNPAALRTSSRCHRNIIKQTNTV